MPDFKVLEALGFPPLPGEGAEKRRTHLDALREAAISLNFGDGEEAQRSPRRAEWIAATVEAAGKGLRIPLEPFESLERGEYSREAGGLLDADLQVARWFRRCALLRVSAMTAVIRSVLGGVEVAKAGVVGMVSAGGDRGIIAAAAGAATANSEAGDESVPALSKLLDARPGGALCSVVLDLIPLLCTERASSTTGALVRSEWTSPKVATAARSLLGFLLSSEGEDPRRQLVARFAVVNEALAAACGEWQGERKAGNDDDNDDLDDDDDDGDEDNDDGSHRAPLDKRQMRRLNTLLPSIVAAVRPSLLGHARALALANESSTEA